MLVNSGKTSCWIANGNTQLYALVRQLPTALRPLPHDTPRARTFPPRFRQACHHPRGAHNASSTPCEHYLLDSPLAIPWAWEAWEVIHCALSQMRMGLLFYY